jgi:hypothetical protein
VCYSKLSVSIDVDLLFAWFPVTKGIMEIEAEDKVLCDLTITFQR